MVGLELLAAGCRLERLRFAPRPDRLEPWRVSDWHRETVGWSEATWEGLKLPRRWSPLNGIELAVKGATSEIRS